jgi:hypothetical protein
VSNLISLDFRNKSNRTVRQNPGLPVHQQEAAADTRVLLDAADLAADLAVVWHLVVVLAAAAVKSTSPTFVASIPFRL